MPGPGADAVVVPAELRAAHAAYLAAWNGDDPAAVGAFYTDDTHGMIGDSMYHGRARLVSAWVTPNLPTLTELTAMPAAFATRGNAITETGRYTFRPVGAGAPPLLGGTYTNVWTRQSDGSWRITSTTVGQAAPIP